MVKEIKAIFKSKTFSEFIDKFPSGYIEFMAFTPLFVFMIIPLWQFLHNVLNQGVAYSAYYSKTYFAFVLCCSIGVAAIALYIAKNIHEHGKPSFKSVVKENVPLAFFAVLIVLMLIATCVNGFDGKALYGDIYTHESLFKFISYFALYFPLATIISSERLRETLLYSFIISSLPVAIFGFIDYVIVPLDAFDFGAGLSGVFHNSNHYGYYLAMVMSVSAVLFIKEKRTPLKILCGASFLINNIVMIENDSFGSYIACFAALIFICVIISLNEQRFNKLALVMPAVFIAVSVVMGLITGIVSRNFTVLYGDLSDIAENSENAGHAGSNRWQLWMFAVDIIKEHPIFGYGIEGQKRMAMELGIVGQNGIGTSTHNDFLQYAVFFGIPAALTYICGVFSVFLNGLKNRLRLDNYALAGFAGAFAYLVSSATGVSMHYTTPYMFILLGLAFTRSKQCKA